MQTHPGDTRGGRPPTRAGERPQEPAQPPGWGGLNVWDPGHTFWGRTAFNSPQGRTPTAGGLAPNIPWVPSNHTWEMGLPSRTGAATRTTYIQWVPSAHS